jgi:hypothetical protein
MRQTTKMSTPAMWTQTLAAGTRAHTARVSTVPEHSSGLHGLATAMPPAPKEPSVAFLFLILLTGLRLRVAWHLPFDRGLHR